MICDVKGSETLQLWSKRAEASYFMSLEVEEENLFQSTI